MINSIDHIFARTAGGVFRSMNDADQWSDVGGGLLPPGGNVWAVATEGIGSGEFAYAGTAGGGVFRSVHSIAVVRGLSETEASPNASTTALRVCRLQQVQEVRLVGSSSATFRRGE